MRPGRTRDAGLTHPDYNRLARLSAAPNRTLGMSALADQLKFTRSRLTRAVIRLEESGYARRRAIPLTAVASWWSSPAPAWTC
jgi:DNA-binding MarR family transcriptional regulator